MSTLSRPFLVLFLLAVVICGLYFGFRSTTPEMCKAIPAGGGPLIVKSGTTITLDAGEKYEYSSILIHKGGVLEIVGKNPEWTTIKSRGNFRVEGTIRSKGFREVDPDPSMYLFPFREEEHLASLKEIETDSLRRELLNFVSSDSFAVKVPTPTFENSELSFETDSLYWEKLKKEFLSKNPNSDSARYDSMKYNDVPFFLAYFPNDVVDVEDECQCRQRKEMRKVVKLTKAKFLRLDSSRVTFNVALDQKVHHVDSSINLAFSHQYGNDSKGGQGGAGGRPEECKKKSCISIADFDGEKGLVGKGGRGSPGMSACNIANCKRNSKKDSCMDCDIDAISPGKGGKGGSKGTDGGLLYLAACGNFIADDGIIDVSGGQGGKGGNGKSNKYTGGGGGGGGPGGNGGMIYLNVCGQLTIPTTLLDGGPGGVGGKGGTAHKKDGLLQYKGQDGKKGQKGAKGKLVIDQSCGNPT